MYLCGKTFCLQSVPQTVSVQLGLGDGCMDTHLRRSDVHQNPPSIKATSKCLLTWPEWKDFHTHPTFCAVFNIPTIRRRHLTPWPHGSHLQKNQPNHRPRPGLQCSLTSGMQRHSLVFPVKALNAGPVKPAVPSAVSIRHTWGWPSSPEEGEMRQRN